MHPATRSDSYSDVNEEKFVISIQISVKVNKLTIAGVIFASDLLSWSGSSSQVIASTDLIIGWRGKPDFVYVQAKRISPLCFKCLMYCTMQYACNCQERRVFGLCG